MSTQTTDFVAQLTAIQDQINGHRARQAEIDPEYRRAAYHNDKGRMIELINENQAITDLIAALEVRFVEVQAQQIEHQEREARARAEELKAPFEEADRAYRIAAQRQGETHARLQSAVQEADQLAAQVVGIRATLASMQANLNRTSVWR